MGIHVEIVSPHGHKTFFDISSMTEEEFVIRIKTILIRYKREKNFNDPLYVESTEGTSLLVFPKYLEDSTIFIDPIPNKS